MILLSYELRARLMMPMQSFEANCGMMQRGLLSWLSD